MRKILIVMIVVVLTVSMSDEKGVSIFTYDKNEEIIPKDSFIDKVDIKRFEDLSYNLIGSNTIKLPTKEITISSSKFQGWKGDPGYNVIEFIINNKVIYKYISIAGIVTFNPPKGSSYGKDLRKYANNDYFIEYPIENGKIVVFIGHSYSTSQPQLVIFTVTDNGVKLVFDKKYRVSDIIKTSTEFRMIIESQSKQLVSMNPEKWSEPVTHEIYLEDGVLKFKDN